MASNPGRIPAGGRDKIGVEVKTRNRGGSTLHKGFTVYTNDPSKSQVKLMVIGKVKGHISLSPAYIRFMGKEGQQLSRTVTIKPLNSHRFNIEAVQTQEGKNLQYDLKPLGGNADKHGYQLVVRNTMQSAGSYRDLITIKTDSKFKPLLRIPVSARILKAPAQGTSKTQ